MHATALVTHPLSWRRELLHRAGTLWFVKMLARAISFRPETLPLYLSLWAYISLGPALLRNGRELMSYGLATLALSVAGLGIFLVWPTAVPPFEIDWSLHPSMSFLKNLDLAGNACPSLHVAFAVFTAIWMARLLRDIGSGRALRVLNWLWCLGILYSTVAIRQHVMLDVLAGRCWGRLSPWCICGPPAGLIHTGRDPGLGVVNNYWNKQEKRTGCPLAAGAHTCSLPEFTGPPPQRPAPR